MNSWFDGVNSWVASISAARGDEEQSQPIGEEPAITMIRLSTNDCYVTIKNEEKPSGTQQVRDQCPRLLQNASDFPNCAVTRCLEILWVLRLLVLIHVSWCHMMSWSSRHRCRAVPLLDLSYRRIGQFCLSIVCRSFTCLVCKAFEPIKAKELHAHTCAVLTERFSHFLSAEILTVGLLEGFSFRADKNSLTNPPLLGNMCFNICFQARGPGSG